MFQRGVSPVRLSQLDVRPAVEAAQMVAAAKANLNSSVNQSILNFAQKQQKKKQDKIGIKAIQNMYGLDETTAKAVYSDEIVRDAFKQKQKSDENLIRKQREQVELDILKRENELAQKNQSALEKAIAVNTTPEGTLDASGLDSAFVEFGGTNKDLLNTFKGPGEIKISDKGIITQDGKYKGQIAAELLNKKDDSKDKFDPEKLKGIDKEAYDYAIANPETPESEEILKRLGAK